MARLPQPGGDSGSWGTVLNDFLLQAHKTDGALKDKSVSTSTIVSGAVTADLLADGAVSETKLTPTVQQKLNTIASTTDPAMGGDLTGTASSAQLAAGVVGATELAAGGVTTVKIADGNVTEAKLETALRQKINTAAAGNIADGSITAAKLYTGSGTTGQSLVLDNTAPGGFRWETISTGSAAPSGSAGGALAGLYPNPSLANAAVTTAALADGAVSLSKIASTGATNGQVLGFNGTGLTWVNQTGSGDP
ncbi:MAG: hypothetical protein ACM3MA_02440, partial [Acidobacteriota bacterium]